MTEMMNWWDSLGLLGQVFACVAVPATLILLIQTVLLLLGLGEHGSGDADADAGPDGDVSADAHDGIFGENALEDAGDGHGDSPADGGLRLFTFRGMIAFFSVMGWTGIVCVKCGLPSPLSVAVGLLAGVLAMVGVALLMKWMFSLQYDGSENIRSALGVGGTVYLRVPPSRTGRGKVNLMIQGAWTEKFAVTDEETELRYGEEIIVVGVSGGTTLVVKRKNT